MFDKANASGAIVGVSAEVMGGGNFGEMWKLDTDKHAFVNKKTNEVRAELFVQVAEAHPNRVLFGKNQEGRVCYSDDANSSYQGIACMSCPRVSEVNVFNKYYEAHPEQTRPAYVGDCSLRYTVAWHREFVSTPEGGVCIEHAERTFLSCPKSSVYAMFGSNAYMTKLQQMGKDITKVVTKILVKQRMNESIKKMYDFADFDYAGTVDEIMARVVKTVQIGAGQTAQPMAAPAPAASFPGQALPTGAPASFPQSGLPTMAGPAPSQGFPAPAAPAAMPAGFPSPTALAAAPGFPAPSAPGFPPQMMAQPGAGHPPAAQAAPQMSFAQMARQSLVADFATLPPQVQPIVLNVLQVKSINDVADDRLIQAQQAVQSAKNFQPQPVAAGAAPAGAGPAAPGTPGYPF